MRLYDFVLCVLVEFLSRRRFSRDESGMRDRIHLRGAWAWFYQVKEFPFSSWNLKVFEFSLRLCKILLNESSKLFLLLRRIKLTSLCLAKKGACGVISQLQKFLQFVLMFVWIWGFPCMATDCSIKKSVEAADRTSGLM